MATTQMNVRIDADVKRRGDAALARAGFTPTQAVRRVWEHVAALADSPEEVVRLLGEPDEGGSRERLLLRESADALGLVDALVAKRGPLSAEGLDYDELRYRAWKERLTERGCA